MSYRTALAERGKTLLDRVIADAADSTTSMGKGHYRKKLLENREELRDILDKLGKLD